MKWYERADEGRPGVVSSRVRLARNWDEYVFPAKLSERDSEEMLHRLEFGLKDISGFDGRRYEYCYLKEVDELQRKALWERRVFNSTIAARKAPAGLYLSEEEDTGILLNGSDHIRLQVVSTGFHLDELWKRVDQLDDYVNERFSYAFDDKYGYLTAFPTNVGTGMRASVILHLPTLCQGKKFSGLVAEMGRFGAIVKGVYGEGDENYGALYEVSNQRTLGLSEKEIIDLVSKVAIQLAAQEQQVRNLSLEKHRLEREDEAYKSYGILKYARRLTRKDAMMLLSQIMLGISTGVLRTESPFQVYRLMLGIQPANLQKRSDRPLGKVEIDRARADYLRAELPVVL